MTGDQRGSTEEDQMEKLDHEFSAKLKIKPRVEKRHKVCRDFQRGRCNRGNACWYSHDVQANSEAVKRTGVKEKSEKRKEKKKVNNASENRNKNKNRNRSKHDKVRKDYFETYYSDAEIKAGIASEKIYTGVLRINKRNRSQAFVSVDGLKVDIFVEGDKDRNRALNGDVVAVELYPKSKWNQLDDVRISLLEKEKEKDDSTVHNANFDGYNRGLWQPLVTEKDLPDFKTKSNTNNSTRKHKMLTTSKKDFGNFQPTGKVVGLIASNEGQKLSQERMDTQAHVGILVPQYGYNRKSPSVLTKGKPLPAGDMYVEFHPLDNRLPYMLVPRHTVPTDFVEDPFKYAPPKESLFLVALSKWEEGFRFPKGRYIGHLGEAGEIGPETEALLVENNCDHGEFPDETIKELDDFLAMDVDRSDGEWKIPAEEITNRRDMRHVRICSIDPSTAKDLDDALHITKIPASKTAPEHYEIGVHIADVTYFVRPGTALDKEAKRRATTVYLVQQVIPMLPPILSEQLCSLNPGVDRLAYSCIWKMTLNGDLLPNTKPWFGRTIIRSCAKLDYGLAQDMIDGKVTAANAVGDDPTWPLNRRPISPFKPEDLCEDVKLLAKIGLARRKNRYDSKTGGALAMTTIKLSFTLGPDGNPSGMKQYPILDSNRLIEEYMLLANYLVAQQLILKAKDKAFLRRHPPPNPHGVEKVLKSLQVAGKGDILGSNANFTAGSLHAALEALRHSTDEEAEDIYLLINTMLSEPMQSALYFVGGELKPYEWKHWALHMPYYTHFTSPIRRYADVCVHRILTATLDGSIKNYPESEDELSEKAQHCNEKKEAAKLAGFQSDKVFFCIYVRQMYEKGTPLLSDAMVLDMGLESFTLLLLDFGVDCRVHATKEWHAKSVQVVYVARPEENENANDKGKSKGKSKGKGKGKVQRDKDRREKSGQGTRGKERGNNGKTERVSNLILVVGKNEKVDIHVSKKVKVSLKPSTNNGRISFVTSFYSQY